MTEIDEALRNIRSSLASRGFRVQARSTTDLGETKLLVHRDNLVVKVEVNTVMRGTIKTARRSNDGYERTHHANGSAPRTAFSRRGSRSPSAR